MFQTSAVVEPRYHVRLFQHCHTGRYLFYNTGRECRLSRKRWRFFWREVTEIKQAANLVGFRASEDPRFEAGIPDFMNGILNLSIHFNVVHRKVDWRNPKMKSLNSMPVKSCIYSISRCLRLHTIPPINLL